nr:hypothetical protein [Schwartzia sp. (in: firmicutes)]
MKKTAAALCAAVVLIAGLWVLNELSAQTVLRIYDYETKEIYVEVPAKEGDQLFFGWNFNIDFFRFVVVNPKHSLCRKLIQHPQPRDEDDGR